MPGGCRESARGVNEDTGAISGGAAYLVVRLEVETLLDAGAVSARVRGARQATYVALRPMGVTLIMPFRNSMNVPLYRRTR